MLTFLLVVFTQGFPPYMMHVDNIATIEDCRTLGTQITARAKMANSVNRYSFECYSVNRTLPSQP